MLASNSLLEGLVFGRKIGGEVAKILKDSNKRKVEVSINYRTDRTEPTVNADDVIKHIQHVMTEHVGIVRNREGLIEAKQQVGKYYELVKNMKNYTLRDFEMQNIVLLATLVIDSALEREESRGAHYRSDFTKTDDVNWKRNIIKQLKI